MKPDSIQWIGLKSMQPVKPSVKIMKMEVYGQIKQNINFQHCDM